MIRIVLCDDNPAFLESMRSHVRRILCEQGMEAALFAYANAGQIPEQLISEGDLFFLDVDFSGEHYTGLDIARRIRRVRQDSVLVFVTNFIEYAPEGYEVQAFRYLLKQDMERKLQKTVLDAVEQLRQEHRTLQIQIHGEVICLPLTEILYVESQLHVAVIHVQKPGSREGRSYSFYSPLSRLEQELRDKGFLRIHKSYLVNMRRIKKYLADGVTLDNGTLLPASRRNYGQLKKECLLWKGRN